MAVLVPHQIMPVAGWADTVLCSVFANALNKYLQDKWLPCDSRFRLAAAISPHEPTLAAQEIDRVAADSRVAAVSMPMLAPHPGQSVYRPFLQAASPSG